jgi:adhesin HecA-like repeat protein
MKILTQFVMKAIIVIIAIAGADIHAATTWTGASSTEWNNASNWSSGIPDAADDVTIPTSPTGGRFPVISSGTFATKKLTIQSGATLTQNGGTLSTTDNVTITGTFTQTAGTFTTSDNKITIDGGTFTQSDGTVTTKDMEIKNSGTYNQSGGEFQISHDLKVTTGNTFNATGGTVRFTGAAGAGAIYTGNVQFHNLIINAGANYNLAAGDVIKISGDYTNNNASLDNQAGTLNFNGTTPQSITSSSDPAAGETIAGNILFSGSTTYTLLSNVGAHTDINVQSGHVDLNGNLLYESGGIYDGPTPVELASFNAKVRNNAVQLFWKTATEVDNYGFEIQRSLDSKTWDKIGFVNGHGNSNSPKEYSFEDSKLSNNSSYQYRLKQVDNDGSFSYSNSVSVSIDQMPANFTLFQNYPNPFNPTTVIKYAIAEESFVTIKVYNIIGSEIATLVNENLSAGSYEYNFNASSLSSGAYIYKIQAGGFSETRKMILSK